MYAQGHWRDSKAERQNLPTKPDIQNLDPQIYKKQLNF